MEIKAYRRLIELEHIRHGIRKTPLERMAILDRGLTYFNKWGEFLSFAKPVNESGQDELRPTRSAAHVVLKYKDGVKKDLAETYADSVKLEAHIRSILRKRNLECYFPGRFGDDDISLRWESGHSLMFPATVCFHEDHGYLPQQKNKLIVRCVGNPSKKTRAEIVKYCKEAGASARVLMSSRAIDAKGREEFSLNFENGGMTYGMSAPETQVEVKWKGDDFDTAAIHHFGEIRKMLFENHARTVKRYCGQLLTRAYQGNPGQLFLNQEGRNEGIYVGDIAGHFSCDVPFMHDKKRMMAMLSYNDFRGR